jgi:excisionase family DNA binding protein
MSPNKLPAFYTVDELCHSLEVTPRTVRRWIGSGLLSAYKVGRQWRVPQADLDAFLASGRQHALHVR